MLMSNEAALYWVSRLDNLNGVFIGTLCMYAVCTIIFGRYWSLDGADNFSISEEDRKKYSSYDSEYRTAKTLLIAWKRFTVVAIICLIGVVFVPTKKEIIFITVGGKALDYAQSDTSLQKMPYKITELVNTLINEKLKEK